MKKRILGVLLILILSIATVKADALAQNTATLDAVSSVRQGETVVLMLSAGIDSVYGINGFLEYDNSQLELTGLVTTDEKNWSAEIGPENSFIAYDNTFASPKSSSDGLLMFFFELKETVMPDTEITVRLTDVDVSDMQITMPLGDVEFKGIVKEAKSTDCTLGSIKVNNGVFEGAFVSSLTEYEVKLPYSETKLELEVETTSDRAEYFVDGNEDLEVGINEVIITVIAENEDRKEYKLIVERERDPERVLSDNALLEDIELSAGSLSPKFSYDVSDYIVYVNHEIEEITLTGKTKDKWATVEPITRSLVDGNNTFILICTAEDGVTKRFYTVNVYRMPEYEGNLPIVNPTPTIQPTPVPEPANDNKVSGLLFWIVFIIAVMLLGVAVWLLTEKLKKR